MEITTVLAEIARSKESIKLQYDKADTEVRKLQNDISVLNKDMIHLDGAYASLDVLEKQILQAKQNEETISCADENLSRQVQEISETHKDLLP